MHQSVRVEMVSVILRSRYRMLRKAIDKPQTQINLADKNKDLNRRIGD